MSINERVLGMPVSLSPLHKSIKEFIRAVSKVDSELKVCMHKLQYVVPVPYFKLSITSQSVFLLGTTDMENLGTMEKLPIEGQRHQRPVDDD
jgi:hypothetical protein